MSTRWLIDPTVAFVIGDERVALVDLRDPVGPPLVLLGTGASIWNAIDGDRDTDTVVREVAGLYEVNPAEIREQVEDFLTDLEHRHLIVRT